MNILFLCVANSIRSQMAEGLARAMFGDQVVVQSAGSSASFVNPLTVTVLAELGIDISQHRSKSVDSIDLRDVDLVITLCAEEICPVVSTKTSTLHWPFPDPYSGKNPGQVERFREVREMIREKLAELGEERGWKIQESFRRKLAAASERGE